MPSGKLILIIGPMFAAKTTYLLKKINQLPGNQVLVAKPKLDNRYRQDKIVSHDGIYFSAKVVDEKDNQALIKLYRPNYKYLFLDELTLFDFGIIWPQLSFYLDKGVSIWASGIEYDYQGRYFGPIHRLRPYADKIIKLYAVCDGCGAKASLSYRKKAKKGRVIIGGSELYGACCPKCYPKLNHG